MKFEIEVKADHVDWKELIAKINEAISEETTDLSFVKVSYEKCDDED